MSPDWLEVLQDVHQQTVYLTDIARAADCRASCTFRAVCWILDLQITVSTPMVRPAHRPVGIPHGRDCTERYAHPHSEECLSETGGLCLLSHGQNKSNWLRRDWKLAGEKAGLSPDALKGMFQRSAAQQSPQPAARKTLLSTAASSQQQSASTSVPSLSTPLGAGTRPQAPAVSLPCGAPGSWGSDLLDRLRSLPALPTQEDSINGLCIDLIGGMPAQIYALDSGNMKAWSLLDGKQVW